MAHNLIHHPNRPPEAYMSVRIKPTREQIKVAEALYARVKAQRESGRAPTFEMHAGADRRFGWRAKLGAREMQLGNVTQQNAALVEEVAAATTALNQSAVTLTRAVQVFRAA